MSMFSPCSLPSTCTDFTQYPSIITYSSLDTISIADDSNIKHFRAPIQKFDDANENENNSSHTHNHSTQNKGNSTDKKETKEVALALQAMIPPATPLTHTQHELDKEQLKKKFLLGDRKATAEQCNRRAHGTASSSSISIGITCMVSLKIARIVIGACTDSLFRFWDLDSAKVICSCSVGLELKTVHDVEGGGGGGRSSRIGSSKKVVTRNDMQLSCLTLSPDEELLIGGYDNGEIRIWIVSMVSINNIRVTQKEIISGMSVPPIQLLNEWTGHDSAVRSLDVVVLDEENWGSHELYLVSSGQDQGVHLWTVSGEHIGKFGASKGWDLEDKTTWRVSTDKYNSADTYIGGGMGGFAPSGPPSTPGRSRPSYRRCGSQPKTYRIAPNDKDTNYFRMAKLNHHMEKVKIKNHKKLTDPSMTEIHCEMVNEAQARYPMAEVDPNNAFGGVNGKATSPSRRGKSATSATRPAK